MIVIYNSSVIVGFCVLRVQINSLAEIFDRLLIIAEFAKCFSSFIVSLSILSVQFYSPVEIFEYLLIFAELGLH